MAKLGRRPHVLAHLALTGALAGALVGVAGCNWLTWPADDHDFGFCDEAYDHCLEWAVSAQEVKWCEDDVANCYDACEGTWEEDDDDETEDDDDGETGGENTTTTTTGGDGGDPTDGGDTSETGDETGSEEDICIELFGNCIDGAETLE